MVLLQAKVAMEEGAETAAAVVDGELFLACTRQGEQAMYNYCDVHLQQAEDVALLLLLEQAEESKKGYTISELHLS